MKTNLLSMILAGLFLPTALHAEPPPPGDGPGKGNSPPPKHPGRKAWKSADANDDKLLTFEEFSQLPRPSQLDEEERKKLFERLDKNGDGKINPREMMAGRKHPYPPFPRLWELDTDKSRGVSLEEFRKGEMVAKLPAAKQEEIFKHLDKDGDGQITAKDRPARRPGKEGKFGRPDPGHLLRPFDEDNDGALSFEEFRKNPRVKDLPEAEQKDRFQKLDRNGDGKWSREDFPPPPPKE